MRYLSSCVSSCCVGIEHCSTCFVTNHFYIYPLLPTLSFSSFVFIVSRFTLSHAVAREVSLEIISNIDRMHEELEATECVFRIRWNCPVDNSVLVRQIWPARHRLQFPSVSHGLHEDVPKEELHLKVEVEALLEFHVSDTINCLIVVPRARPTGWRVRNVRNV